MRILSEARCKLKRNILATSSLTLVATSAFGADGERAENIIELLMKATLLGTVWVLWLMIILSVITVGIIGERGWFFYKNRIDFAGFIDKITQLLNNEKTDEAVEYAKNHRSIEGQMITEGLANVKKGSRAIEKAMSAFYTRQRIVFDRGLTFLNTVGNNAPFIGLFGTVLGIIQAFHDLSLNPAGGPTVVMAGISEALVATAVGLFVAIPAVMANNTFQRMIKEKLTNMEAAQDIVLTHCNDKKS